MARKGRRAPRGPEPRPDPLPPARRTVGQLVAETISFYRHHFFQALPLGLAVALLAQLTFPFGRRYDEPYGHPPAKNLHDAHPILGGGFVTVLVLSSLLFTGAFIVAIVLVTGVQPQTARIVKAYALGVLVFVPAQLFVGLLGIVGLPAILYLALLGWAVPVALLEGTGVRESLRRGSRLGRVDYVHAAGGLATLLIVVVVVRFMVVLLTHFGGEIGVRSASFLADLVLSPILFLGSALLYLDQAAREQAKQ